MAQTGKSKIQLYSSSTAATAPSAGNLTNDTNGSEIAINIADGTLFYKDGAGAVRALDQDGQSKLLGTVTGTNTITASANPPLTAYKTGQVFRFIAAGSNSGATTININGLGAKAITKLGTSALTGGELASNATAEVFYDGTQFQLTAVANPLVAGGNVGAADATTQAAKDNTTKVATTAFVDQLRGLLTSATSGTLVLSDRGCRVPLAAGITVPSAVFAANDVVTLDNTTGASITITQGSGLTLRTAGGTVTGNYILAAHGLATMVFRSGTEAVISGNAG
jgi:hypothetical protein